MALIAVVAMFLIPNGRGGQLLDWEAGNVGFRRLSVGYHVIALAVFAVVSPWWLIGFGPALLRSLVLRPGLRPAVIGAVETVVAVLFVVAAALAV